MISWDIDKIFKWLLTKTHHQENEKEKSAILASDNGLLIQICKEPLQINNKTINNPIKKWTTWT